MAKTELFNIRITVRERQAFDAAAAHAGMPVTSWMRQVLHKAADIHHAITPAKSAIPIATKRESKKPFVCRLKGYKT